MSCEIPLLLGHMITPMESEQGATLDPMGKAWWKEAVIYQIYPRSFNDSDGDGIGDIQGIIEKIDYIDDLGVDAVWLNPVYESPQVDNGYDISDYHAINPEYGTMDDWERLLETLHDRDIRLIMDLVLNHTSSQHSWFQRSREADGEYADYYYWRDGEDLPNNWETFFEQSAWTYDDSRGEYYLHLFTDEQPDLNWRNPIVRNEIYDIVSWWLERGIDGFRLDVINLISKTDGLPDGDPDGEFLTGSEHFINGPEMHEYFDELAKKGFGPYRDKTVTIGECSSIDPETAIDVTGRKSNALDMTIFFEHLELDREAGWQYREWSLPELKTIMDRWQQAVDDGTWVTLYHSNHDQPRGLSRFGDERYRYESATMLATCIHGHRGTPLVYQGEEFGMSNATFDSPADLRDVWAKNHWENERAAGKSFDEVRPDIERYSRDNARTPMQWTDEENAGFTSGEPWIPVDTDYETVNADIDRTRDRSIFEYYRALIDLRNESELLAYGSFELLLPMDEQIYAFRRTLPDCDTELLVVCNFIGDRASFNLPDQIEYETAEVVLSNLESITQEPAEIDLRPYEAAIYRLSV